MQFAPKLSLPIDDRWTLKDRDELFLFCQRFSQRRQGFSALYDLQIELRNDQWRGKESLIPIIVHECFSRTFSPRDVETAISRIDMIDTNLRDGFAIGLALCHADQRKDKEVYNDAILRLGMTELEAVKKLTQLPDLFRGEQYAIRLRPLLTPEIKDIIESHIVGSLAATEVPTQRFMSSLIAYLNLGYDQDQMPSEMISSKWLKKPALNAVQYLLTADRIHFQANAMLLKMLGGWLRSNLQQFDPGTSPFLAVERLKIVYPAYQSGIKELPSAWRKLLVIENTQEHTAPAL